MRLSCTSWLIVGAMVSTLGWAQAQDTPKNTDEQAIRQLTQSFVDAFNKGDIKAMAALWTPEGDFVGEDGRKIHFQKQLAARAANRPEGIDPKDAVRPRLRMFVDSVRLITPRVANVDGSSIFNLFPGAPDTYGRYSAIWVKGDTSGWQLDSVRENHIEKGAQHLHLMSLDWMLGTWVDADGKARIETTLGWAPDGNFLERPYCVSIPGRGDQRGIQRIGWDAKLGQFRSWNFDSDGSFSQGIWREIENGFEIEVSGVTADGRSTGSLMTIIRTGDNSIEWQSTEATENGAPLPDLKLKLVRKATK